MKFYFLPPPLGSLITNGTGVGGGMFGSGVANSGTGSLLAKLVRPGGQSGLGGVPLGDKTGQTRSRVLEDFR